MEIPKNDQQTSQEEEDWYQSQSMLYLKFNPTKFDAYTWNPNDCFWRSISQNKASSRCIYSTYFSRIHKFLHVFPHCHGLFLPGTWTPESTRTIGVEAGSWPEGVAPHQFLEKSSWAQSWLYNHPLLRPYSFWGACVCGVTLRFPFRMTVAAVRCQVSDEQQMRRENQQLKELRHEERGVTGSWRVRNTSIRDV